MAIRASSRADILALRIKDVEHCLGYCKEPVGLHHRLQASGARFRFNSGADEMRHGGVSATCTAGGVQLVKNWVKAAERKLVKLRQDEADAAAKRKAKA